MPFAYILGISSQPSRMSSGPA